ncbi:MAG: replication-associated recombination protein A [Tenericutes bacterium]|jgi:putative ATPase|nr:replication-associated recombination protein A [Mycoplasmatota bacterium]
MNEPLAIKLAPSSLKDVLGQQHLIGQDKILSNLVKNKKIFSMILYGGPGIGKTSIAKAIVNDLNIKYRLFNATINNKRDLDIIIEEAKLHNGMIVIIDEIHRLNKDKQDLLLFHLESGLITLIGLTTGNPYHIINPAVRSRCQIFELKDLTTEDILKGLKNAIKTEYLKDIKIDNESLKYIANISGNDLRYAYNLLEMAYYASKDKNIDLNVLKDINNKPAFFIDKDGDGYYDVLSAFQKSIRGSDVDASLHYLGRLLKAEDLDSIHRRLLAIAYEDIGLANPNICSRVLTAIQASERLGMDECRIPLANIVIELSLSPKSNSAILAIDKVLEDINTGRCGLIPNHLKKPFINYFLPHNYPNSYIKQQYLPNNLINKRYYIPKTTSKYEQTLKQINDNIKK